MTRYTKLEGRRALPSAGQTDADDEAQGVQEPVHNAPPAKERAPAPESGSADPKALLKRAKLLRLKAKKSKSEESRREYAKKVRELEKAANFANGKRGALGKRQRGPGGPSFDRHDRSEYRRKRRADERASTMHCYVCRGTGHSARDCPQSVGEGSSAVGRDTVGICFRCGSTEHTLSKCRHAPKRGDELPYATCYVCSEKGHLASRCPRNQGRGVYPNGGDCKVCHSVEHLARDCPMNSERSAHAGSVEAGGVGVLAAPEDGAAIGADEDEFHLLAQRRAGANAPNKPAPARKPAKKVVSF